MINKSYMLIGGRNYRIEVNWNALSAFLIAVGRDTLKGLSEIKDFRPSEITALIAAAANEGERLDGRESNLTAIEVGSVIRPEDVNTFMGIYIEQSRPQQPVAEKPAGQAKKKK